MMSVQPQYARGFTLVEILITFSIVAILCLFAFPFGQDFLLKNKLSARTEEIVTALHFARSQAALLNQPLVLAPLHGDWSTGMVLFIDQNNNHTYESDDNRLFQWEWTDNDLQVSWQGMYEHYLLFTPSELTSVLGGSFYLCPLLSSLKGKKIQMNRVGRVRVEVMQETCHT